MDGATTSIQVQCVSPNHLPWLIEPTFLGLRSGGAGSILDACFSGLAYFSLCSFHLEIWRPLDGSLPEAFVRGK